MAFQSPTVPVLLQILSGKQKASDLLPPGSIYGLEASKSVELTIPAFALGGPVRHGLLICPDFRRILTPLATFSILFTCMA